LTPYEAKIVFYDKKLQFQGIIHLKTFKISIVTEKNGFKFFKELHLDEIKQLKIKKWFGFKNKDGSFVFYPYLIEITDIKGTSFDYNQNIKEINQILFETEYGKTKFFSYFYDYFKDNVWELTRRKGNAQETEIALPKVIFSIELIKPVILPLNKKTVEK
jgi:hypothetical protein